MPRFVILEHDHPHLHWDLMLEAGEVLKTWRLASPLVAGAQEISATPLGEHRRAYLDYEGPVSGGRGTVRRWDGGIFETIAGPGKTGSERWVFKLEGQSFKGTAALEPPSLPGPWRLVILAEERLV